LHRRRCYEESTWESDAAAPKFRIKTNPICGVYRRNWKE
jgi:hypothetical protein